VVIDAHKALSAGVFKANILLGYRTKPWADIEACPCSHLLPATPQPQCAARKALFRHRGGSKAEAKRTSPGCCVAGSLRRTIRQRGNAGIDAGHGFRENVAVLRQNSGGAFQ